MSVNINPSGSPDSHGVKGLNKLNEPLSDEKTLGENQEKLQQVSSPVVTTHTKKLRVFAHKMMKTMQKTQLDPHGKLQKFQSKFKTMNTTYGSDLTQTLSSNEATKNIPESERTNFVNTKVNEHQQTFNGYVDTVSVQDPMPKDAESMSPHQQLAFADYVDKNGNTKIADQMLQDMGAPKGKSGDLGGTSGVNAVTGFNVDNAGPEVAGNQGTGSASPNSGKSSSSGNSNNTNTSGKTSTSGTSGTSSTNKASANAQIQALITFLDNLLGTLTKGSRTYNNLEKIVQEAQNQEKNKTPSMDNIQNWFQQEFSTAGGKTNLDMYMNFPGLSFLGADNAFDKLYAALGYPSTTKLPQPTTMDLLYDQSYSAYVQLRADKSQYPNYSSDLSLLIALTSAMRDLGSNGTQAELTSKALPILNQDIFIKADSKIRTFFLLMINNPPQSKSLANAIAALEAFLKTDTSGPMHDLAEKLLGMMQSDYKGGDVTMDQFNGQVKSLFSKEDVYMQYPGASLSNITALFKALGKSPPTETNMDKMYLSALKELNSLNPGSGSYKLVSWLVNEIKNYGSSDANSGALKDDAEEQLDTPLFLGASASVRSWFIDTTGNQAAAKGLSNALSALENFEKEFGSELGAGGIAYLNKIEGEIKSLQSKGDVTTNNLTPWIKTNVIGPPGMSVDGMKGVDIFMALPGVSVKNIQSLLKGLGYISTAKPEPTPSDTLFRKLLPYLANLEKTKSPPQYKAVEGLFNTMLQFVKNMGSFGSADAMDSWAKSVVNGAFVQSDKNTPKWAFGSNGQILPQYEYGTELAPETAGNPQIQATFEDFIQSIMTSNPITHVPENKG